jgi:hypothetical protein
MLTQPYSCYGTEGFDARNLELLLFLGLYQFSQTVEEDGTRPGILRFTLGD